MDKKIFKKYRFLKAEATNTRLMGVVGLIIYWQVDDKYEYCQLFHLDAEEYGIDNYDSILEGEKDILERKKLNMMGGLGGEFVSISEKESRYLVCEFTKINNKFSLPIPGVKEYNFILNDAVHLGKVEINSLWDKVCENIISPNQLINYFIMRVAGEDYEAARYLATEDINYKIVNSPSTLLKNVVKNTSEKDLNSYITESLIDEGDESRHKIVISKIKTKEIDGYLKVINAEIEETMNISAIESAFNLNRKEYILIYDIKNIYKLTELLDTIKPQAMKSDYEPGYLYTEFNPHNKHVNRKVYYLNEDVYASYYITEREFIVATYDEKRQEDLKSYFLGSKFDGLLILKDDIELNQSILYNFINSDYNIFHNFLNELQQ